VEGLKSGDDDMPRKLVSFAENGLLSVSDAFPFIGDELYIPKPVFRINTERGDSDPKEKKIFKKLKYIPIGSADEYLTGGFNAKKAKDISDKFDECLGKPYIMAHAAIHLEKDTEPYHVGAFAFKKGAGLYIIACGNGETLPLLRKLLAQVAYSGIGGRRSLGLGRFSVEEAPVSRDIIERLTGEYPAYITLGVSLPQEDEMETAMENASYVLIRRSGFVFSSAVNPPVRKNDLYVFDSGCTVRRKFKGGVYEVSNNLAHPVYRYAKPLFLGVNV
jgi:CRISPR-associated protein Csm4